MTSKTKQLISIASAIVIVAVVVGGLAWGITACNKSATYKGKVSASPLYDMPTNNIALFVSKTASYKNEVLGAVNQAIDDLGEDKIAELVSHHNKVGRGESSTLSFSIPNPNNNTGGTLYTYSSAEYVPFNYLGANNAVVGVNLDIIKFAAMLLNMKVETVICEFGAVIGYINASTSQWRISCESIFVSPEREEAVAFSDTVWASQVHIISRQAKNYSTLEELSGKKIGLVVGSIVFNNFVQGKIDDGTLSKKTKIQTYISTQASYQAFLTGKVDLILLADFLIASIVGNQLTGS